MPSGNIIHINKSDMSDMSDIYDLNYLLTNAASKGDIDMIIYCIENGAYVHYKENRAIKWAVKNHNNKCVKYLLGYYKYNTDVHEDIVKISISSGNWLAIKRIIQIYKAQDADYKHLLNEDGIIGGGFVVCKLILKHNTLLHDINRYNLAQTTAMICGDCKHIRYLFRNLSSQIVPKHVYNNRTRTMQPGSNYDQIISYIIMKRKRKILPGVMFKPDCLHLRMIAIPIALFEKMRHRHNFNVIRNLEENSIQYELI